MTGTDKPAVPAVAAVAAVAAVESREAREAELRDWFAALPLASGASPTLLSVSDDASFRRYYRTVIDGQRYILCDAPPDKEKNPEFLRIALQLQAAGLRVPRVFAADLEAGFFCLEDLGEQPLLPLLSADTVDDYYQRALAPLLELACAAPGPFALGNYDYAELSREMSLFPEWFCAGYLGLSADAQAAALFSALEQTLCTRALAQTQVVVHRDYHSRNLMVLDDGSLAIIDFQDAVIGPVTYDLVSLLRDCYCRWPDERVDRWALAQRDALRDRGIAVPASDDEFLRDLDWMGLQRHIKVLGIFCRLYLRDGKPGYLRDLPRVAAYTRDVLARYPEEPALAEFTRWFREVVLPAFQHRQRTPPA